MVETTGAEGHWASVRRNILDLDFVNGTVCNGAFPLAAPRLRLHRQRVEVFVRCGTILPHDVPVTLLSRELLLSRHPEVRRG